MMLLLLFLFGRRAEEFLFVDRSYQSIKHISPSLSLALCADHYEDR